MKAETLVNKVEVRRAKLHGMIDRLTTRGSDGDKALEVQLQLEEALTGEERDQEATQWDTLTERIQMARREARARIRQMEDSLSDCSARSNDLDHRSNSKRKANGRLPELKMPVFLDKVLEFPTFWDRFQACVHRRTDLDDASKFAWRMAPMEAFSSEFQALSRLENSELPSHMKHPVILPGDHAYAGSSETAILGAVGTHPIVVEAAAFAHIGMDFAGPLFTRVGRKVTSKCYVCQFTYMASRAVHLELVSQLTTARVMQALRRFIARRGRPKIMQSDNFRSFKATASELRQLWRLVDVDRVQRELVGYWERLVCSIKESLRKILRKGLLDEEELRTTLCEVEACLDARPLTLVGDESHERHPLSPFQLLTDRTYVILCNGTTDGVTVSSSSRNGGEDGEEKTCRSRCNDRNGELTQPVRR
ncbi:hypothetical protein T08_13605 [Trichinella sp. T8]|nr:hypothetical protein T08_13605 [Trichinella sp. T8]